MDRAVKSGNNLEADNDTVVCVFEQERSQGLFSECNFQVRRTCPGDVADYTPVSK